MGLFSKSVKLFKESTIIEDFTKKVNTSTTDIIEVLNKEKNNETKSIVVDNYIVFTSASGGCGVSTLVSNVAYTAARKGFKVVVIDLNIICPTQHTYLNIKQSVDDIDDLVSYVLGRSQLGDSINTSNIYSIMYANNRNIADMINCNDDVAILNFNNMINKLRGLYDLILIDCPMQIDNMLCNNVLYNCDTIYNVWDESLSAISNTDRLRRNMSFCGIDSYTKMHVILNKRTNIHYNMYPFKKLNLDLVEILPFDTSIIESSLKAQIFCEKGKSKSINAREFEAGIKDLTVKILKIGGYVDYKNILKEANENSNQTEDYNKTDNTYDNGYNQDSYNNSVEEA